MMRALDPEVLDVVTELISDTIPEPPVHPIGGGRPRIADHICFRGLFLRLITGLAWETIEVLLDRQVSDTTLRARRDEWIEAGVFDAMMERALTLYDRHIGIDTSHVLIDGSTQLCPAGGEATGVYPGSKGRLGIKWSVATDADGVPIGWVLDGANRNDFALLIPTLDAVTKRERTASIGTLHLDRGYGYDCVTERVRGYDIDKLDVAWRNKPGKGRVKLVGLKQRWKVERTNSWLTNFKQLKLNTDRKTVHRHAAICLATVFIIAYRLIDHNHAQSPTKPIR